MCLCVGLPSTSRPFPHLLGTPTGEPLHFLFLLISSPVLHCIAHIRYFWPKRMKINKKRCFCWIATGFFFFLSCSRRVDFEGKTRQRRRVFLSLYFFFVGGGGLLFIFCMHRDDWIKHLFFFFFPPFRVLLSCIFFLFFFFKILFSASENIRRAHSMATHKTPRHTRKLYKLLRPSVVVCWHGIKNQCVRWNPPSSSLSLSLSEKRKKTRI